MDSKWRRRIHVSSPTTINVEPRPRRESLRKQLLSQLFFKKMSQLFKKKRHARPSTVWYDKVAFPPSAWQGPARVSPYGYESDSENEEYTRINSTTFSNELPASPPTQDDPTDRCTDAYAESPAVLHLDNVSRNHSEAASPPSEVYLDGFCDQHKDPSGHMRPIKRRLYSKTFCGQFAAIHIILLMLQILVLIGIVYRGFGKGCM
ncbi:membrane protein V1 [Equid alphaherpesvirus 8]|uniref:Membrane protein V1 n=1 Tax=Equid alphaherpesvirus 8 TaxID=39637 RepID=I1V8B5_9ALPH|nr:ORF2 gene product [Equid alphaherpesvirus 8]YP_010795042.1 membrane protein V1 [Equid alphaherpesvirus 8]AFI33137.1 membrane protein V1 [Equid alphaherpesvirus 8]AUS94655.1 membrane protein V1 [Equid alphaherpesvirus 8]AUS94735.1 membrane protein V1 [Equid alphaherpesvirus 8]AUS94815.1 membrane protein V1 [Equid alphaherpesvirus 8]UER86453.1 membrane protein V1 [Equid alphaherpesvirus 8]